MWLIIGRRGLSARTVIVKEGTVQNYEEEEKICKSFVSHEKKGRTNSDFSGGRRDPFGLVDAAHANRNEANVSRAARVDPTCGSVTWMSPILVHLNFFVRQVSDVVVIDVLLFIVLVGINQLPELVRVIDLWSDVGFDLLLFDFSQFVVINIELFLASQRRLDRLVASLPLLRPLGDAAAGRPPSWSLVLFEVADYPLGSATSSVVGLVEPLRICRSIVEVITNVLYSAARRRPSAV